MHLIKKILFLYLFFSLKTVGSSCAYTVVISTSCLSPKYTTDQISIIFGDAFGNQVTCIYKTDFLRYPCLFTQKKTFFWSYLHVWGNFSVQENCFSCEEKLVSPLLKVGFSPPERMGSHQLYIHNNLIHLYMNG